MKKYLTRKNSLVVLRMNQAFAGGMAGLFLPILLSQQLLDGGLSSETALAYTIIAFGGTFFFNATFAPIVAKFIHHHGIRSGLILGTVLWSVFYFLLPFANSIQQLFLLFLFNGVGIIFWWHSLNTLFGSKSSHKSYGKDFAWHQIAAGAVSIVAPAFGGVILISSNQDVLYIVSGFVFLLCLLIIPVATKHTEKPKVSSLSKIFNLIHKNPRYVLAYFGEGVSDSSNAVVWPLVVFILADQRYDLTTGLFLIVVLISAATTRLVGVGSDKNPRRSLLTTVFLITAGLLAKIPNILPLSIAGDSLSQIGKSAGLTVSFGSSLRYGERNGNQNSFLVIRELSLNYGRAFGMLIYAGMIVSGLPLTSIFGVAAVGGLFLLLLEPKK